MMGYRSRARMSASAGAFTRVSPGRTLEKWQILPCLGPDLTTLDLPSAPRAGFLYGRAPSQRHSPDIITNTRTTTHL